MTCWYRVATPILRRTGDQWELVDNNSANGTYVNGNRITRAVLGPNDIVGIGHQLLQPRRQWAGGIR